MVKNQKEQNKGLNSIYLWDPTKIFVIISKLEHASTKIQNAL